MYEVLPFAVSGQSDMFVDLPIYVCHLVLWSADLLIRQQEDHLAERKEEENDRTVSKDRSWSER